MKTTTQAMFEDSQTFTKKHPTILTDKQEEEPYRELAQEVRKNDWSDIEVEDIAKDLQELSVYNNGFRMAKRLNRISYGAYDYTGDFIDWLEDIYWKQKRAIDKNVKQWVKAHNITPKWEVGTKLIIKKMLSNNYMLSENTVIFITSVDEELAQYKVNTDFWIDRYYPFDYEIIEENCEVIEEEQE